MKDRKLLMIPGPIEFEPAVLQALGAPTDSHVAPDFVESFGNVLELMKEVWLSPSGQPFVVAGSGTLAMDMAAANLVEPGDNVLVLSTGYFGVRYAEIIKRYGGNITLLEAQLGDIVPLERVQDELERKHYKLMTFTHVDTSTGVLVDAKPVAELAKSHGVLTILDGVCSVGGEEIRQEEWGIDVVLTASQKAIGVPPGLALMMASPEAMDVWEKRNAPVANYYSDWGNWLPIMHAYADRKPSYFGTPPVNLIMGLEASFQIILKEGMEKRFGRHKNMARSFRAAMNSLGISTLAIDDSVAANTLTAAYYPDGIAGGELLSRVTEAGVIIAGGLLAELKAKYFRVGHMGSVNQGDIFSTVAAIETGLKQTGYEFEEGTGLKSAQRAILSTFEQATML